MNREPIIASVSRKEIPAVTDLLLAQETRQHLLEPRLRSVRSRDAIEAELLQHLHSNEQPFAVYNAQGQVRGYAHAAIWELPGHSVLHAFLSPRNGITTSLVLPDPEDEDAHEVTQIVFTHLSALWQKQASTGDLIRWPCQDTWLEPLLFEQGFLLDSICAVFPPQPLALEQRTSSSSLHIRLAQPGDEEALVELFQQELQYHEDHVPCSRVSPLALHGFRAKLARLWAGASLQEGAPFILVVEDEQNIVAMAENTLLEVLPNEIPGFTPPGHYGCIDNVCVSKESRGKGIGRQLMQAVFDVFTTEQLAPDGYALWYNPDNPQAGQFWPHLGFYPLWATYQRLHRDTLVDHLV